MDIVKLQEEQLKEALDLVWEVFCEFEKPEYSTQGVESFKNFIDYDSIIKMYKNSCLKFWGYYDNNELAGIIATKNVNHICLLFVKKQYHRKSIATELFKTVLEFYKNKDVKKITVNSSPYAVEVYHHFGFVDMDKEQEIDGIRFTPMVYKV